ncbi:MAG: carboxypeptidase-like regulatory domain-containing protein [Arachidicoccus sp.]|nr:carboxypeptidase-like regulatory domain-containing protein [Arachidicoccus sp.]
MKKFTFIFYFLLNCLLSAKLFAQENNAFISGKILDEKYHPLENIFVHISNNPTGVHSNDSGCFKLSIPSETPVTVEFSAANYSGYKKIFFAEKNQTLQAEIVLLEKTTTLADVNVSSQKEREQAGLIVISPEKAMINPSPVNGIEGLIKTLVGSNNELTSQYSVRGGNFDENLVYVNGYEIYRPFLVSSGQQEGLSFINPTLTQNVDFFTGGFQTKYGDKMSSVLDVTYIHPAENHGQAYVSLLEQGLSFEGLSKNKKFTYVIGARTRDNRNVTKSQPTQGNYIPSSSDAQALLTYSFSNKFSIELLGNYSKTKFTFYPQSEQLTASVFSPLYAADYGADIDFTGSEKDKYTTAFAGLTFIHKPNKKLNLKYLFSYFGDNEKQNTDITGSYIFGNRDGNGNIDTDPDNLLGEGITQNYARNNLNIHLWSAQHLGSYNGGKNFVQWGLKAERQNVTSLMNQWTRSDSAGYTLPYGGDELQLSNVLQNDEHLNITRFSGFVQDNILFNDSSAYALQVGARFNYNNMNKEFLVSPRIGFSFKPKNWQRDVIFKASGGIYDQPLFYREMIGLNGDVNTQLKAQKSWQVTVGADYSLQVFNRPARWVTEAYYKNMWDVDPYDINNVSIQYYANNNAKAYAYGIETRLFAQLVKDADSWISLGIMRTKENINGLNYTDYLNAEGQVITSSSQDKTVADSAAHSVGWIRRPTDRLVTFGMFFQDYLPQNKNFKVYLNTIFGTNLPYNITGSTRYRNALEIPSYLRVDMGFSALLLDAERKQRSRSPFLGVKNIWASLEVFNLINKDNTISYTLLKSFDNNTYALPNRLTPRLLNFKIMLNW